jgi:hypothetical protein
MKKNKIIIIGLFFILIFSHNILAKDVFIRDGYGDINYQFKNNITNYQKKIYGYSFIMGNDNTRKQIPLLDRSETKMGKLYFAGSGAEFKSMFNLNRGWINAEIYKRNKNNKVVDVYNLSLYNNGVPNSRMDYFYSGGFFNSRINFNYKTYNTENYINIEENYSYDLVLELDVSPFYVEMNSVYTFEMYYVKNKSKPQIQTSSLTFTEGERSIHLINVKGGTGDLSYSTSGVPSGMTFRKVSNGYQVNWKPGYDINNGKSSGSTRRSFNLTVTDSTGASITKNISVYINNNPKPINNINNYKQISSLPDKPTAIKYTKPDIPIFDKDGSLYNKTLLTNITKYSFVEVEDKPPYPGNSPNMIADRKTSLASGNSEEISSSLISGNVKGYRDFSDYLNRYNLARDAYESLDDFIKKQYNKNDLEDSDKFFDKLDRFVNYNNRSNYLGEKVEINDNKDYENMRKIYILLKQKLETRQGKLNSNRYQYNQYTETVNEYNALLDKKINNLVNEYKNIYIPSYSSWLNDKNNYLDNLQNKINEYNNYNNNLYNNKVQEVKDSINKYGLVSLSVSDINKPPNLNSYYLIQSNKFDTSGIANIYNSLKEYNYLSSDVENSIKNKFNNGIYNESKFNWLKNIMTNDLSIDTIKSTDINEKYLIE